MLRTVRRIPAWVWWLFAMVAIWAVLLGFRQWSLRILLVAIAAAVAVRAVTSALRGSTAWLRRSAGVLAFVLAGCAGLGIYWWQPNPARDHLNAVRVPGYARSDEPVGRGIGPVASAVFIGPPVDDIAQLVSAPGLRVTRFEPDEWVKQRILRDGPGPATPVAYGDFTDDCHLTVDRVFDRTHVSWQPNAQQSADLRAGALFVFEFAVTCGAG
ncbi:hypothetical protein [Nocardia pseudobrasiliensis]|nr:hypothetical protein [Nocardia pseudobrasiliensis]